MYPFFYTQPLPFPRNRTFSRGRLVKLLSLKTVEGSHNHPCNAVGGPGAGISPQSLFSIFNIQPWAQESPASFPSSSPTAGF